MIEQQNIVKSSKITNLKRKAKNMKGRTGKSHGECLDVVAQECGYKSWALLMETYNEGKGNR